MNKYAFLFVAMISVGVVTNAQQGRGTLKTTLTASPVSELPSTLQGTSSLFFMNGEYWTCNDHGELVLYAIDTMQATLRDSIHLHATFRDMEEVSQDANYLYLGDFGNNQGTRDDLRVLRVSKTSLGISVPQYDTISFSYPVHDASRARDFDCEAFLVTDTAIFLFTKQWEGQNCAIYAIPNMPGTHVARYVDSLSTAGMVTGLSYQPERGLLVLVGYNTICRPFVYLMTHVVGSHFSQADCERIQLSNPFGTQIESIATTDGLHYYLTSEYLNQSVITRQPTLFELDLSEQIASYLGTDAAALSSEKTACLVPNPTSEIITIVNVLPRQVEVYDLSGRMVLLVEQTDKIDLTPLPKGNYMVMLTLPDGRLERHTIVRL